MGTVYRGVDRTTGERVAVKFVTAAERDRRQRFAREVAVLASIRHPGIVCYIGDGEVDGQPFLMTEWIEGRPLGVEIRSNGFSPAGAVDVLRQLATALGHVHRAGLIHRDLKPSNVVVRGQGALEAKLIDFGIARSVAGGAGRERKSSQPTGAERPSQIHPTGWTDQPSAGWPFLVTASPDDDFTSYADAARQLAEAVPDVRER